jgi:trehalose 6-phosphate synthase
MVSNRSSRLAYFHHVPWCQPDYFGILPEWMRTQILESLLTCDVVSFHCDRWGDAFLACCDSFLPGASIASRTVVYRGRATKVTSAPGPIDAQVLDDLEEQPATARWQDLLTRRANGRKIIARVDRLDLWKNLVRGFSAYEALLRRMPRLAEDYWFCAIVTPPRLQTDRHYQYQATCDEAVKRINSEFADGNAVSLIYPDNSGSQRYRAVAALALSSATLVNPTYDGLNLVAKESLVINPHAPLLLSTNAGVYPQLAGAALPVQPFDIVSTTDALEHALQAPNAYDRKEVDACVTRLRGERTTAWLSAILGNPEH